MVGLVFLSFDHDHDSAFAARLCGQLAASGVVARYDSQQMSQQWWESFTRAQVAAADAVLVVMTPQARSSSWVGQEIELAQRLGKPIVPLLLRGESFAPPAALDVYDARGGEVSGPELARRLRALMRAAHEPSPGPVDEPVTAHGMAGWGAVLVPVERAALAAAVGIETGGGVFVPVIERGKGLPCLREQTFTAAAEGQPSIRVTVFHSNSRRIDESVRVGDFDVRLLDGLGRDRPPAVRVAFAVDERGMFRLSARDDNDRQQPIVSR